MRKYGVSGLKAWLLLVVLLFPAACARLPEKPDGEAQKPIPSGKRGTARPYEVFGKTYYPLSEEEAVGYVEEGMASWYGREFHDRPTANGERFDMNRISAAHTILPLPMLVRVTNLDNGRTLEVRVNDRGPFIDNRLIDLSFAGAEQLGYARTGLARVRVEALRMLAKADPIELYRPRPGTPPSPMVKPESAQAGGSSPWKESSQTANTGAGGKEHYIQLGSFGRYENALEMERRVKKVGKPRIIKSSVGARMMYRVRLGPFSPEQAEQVERTLRQMEIGEAVIIRD
ncbi:MAG: septal ring lytic transglycosylase RlpA family protein [Magnetococcales bacterium]|nr:septal ring lytic transglycosylase RlpA family protein [Magnetococcales bacterium]